MKIKNQVNIGRLIGKIDNDFNLSESDWIPRVAAWTIDALAQMNCLPMEKKKRTLEVSNRIANFPCKLNAKEIKVFTENGCEVEPIGKAACGCGSNTVTISRFDQNNNRHYEGYNEETGEVVSQTTVNLPRTENISAGRNFVIQNNNIELNFDTDKIIVESYEVATYYDDYYDCEVPYIYDNGLLLEALAWYCLYKYLSRGSKHTVYSLDSKSPITNPYIQWNTLRQKAAIATKRDIAEDYTGWRSFFYNSTFDPRNNF